VDSEAERRVKDWSRRIEKRAGAVSDRDRILKRRVERGRLIESGHSNRRASGADASDSLEPRSIPPH
jgi:hypothetical protein